MYCYIHMVAHISHYRTLRHDHYGISLSPWSVFRLGLTTEHPSDEGSRRHITVGDEGLYVIDAHDGAQSTQILTPQPARPHCAERVLHLTPAYTYLDPHNLV